MLSLWSTLFGVEQFISTFSPYGKIKRAELKTCHKQVSELGSVLGFWILMTGWVGEVIVLKLYDVQCCQWNLWGIKAMTLTASPQRWQQEVLGGTGRERIGAGGASKAHMAFSGFRLLLWGTRTGRMHLSQFLPCASTPLSFYTRSVLCLETPVPFFEDRLKCHLFCNISTPWGTGKKS